MAMKCKYSNTEHIITYNNGKEITKYVCDVCGKLHSTQDGFIISLQGVRIGFDERQKYCRKCANKYIPILENAIDEIAKMQGRKTIKGVLAEMFPEQMEVE